MLRVLLVRLEQKRAQGRRKGERDQARDQCRGRDRDGELAVELALDAGDQRRRDEHGREDEGDGEQGSADLVHGLVCRLPRRETLAQVALDVLDHDDRVVDHDADRQHQPEQRQVVQAEAQGRHDGEGADQRDRDRDDRDDRRAPSLQEQDDDDDDQRHGLEDGLDDLVDRLLDELGRVVDDVVVEARREPLPELLHGALDLGRGRQRVGAGQLEDAQGRGGAVVEIGVAQIVLGAELDAGDVADARDPAVGIGLDDDVLELAHVLEPAQRLDAELEGAGVGHRQLIEAARRHLDVLALDRVDHVGRGEIELGHPLRVEPDAHRVVARAEHLDVADAVQAGQHVLDLQRGVVGDVELVERPVRRVEMDHHHQVGRVLLGRDAAPAHLVRQLRLGDRHAVLDQHLRLVEVGAEREGDGDLDVAVSRRLGDHVEHVLDAVDLLLERRRHGLGHDLGRGARVARGDHDGRRRHLGILGDRQREVGDAADQRDDDRDHGREDRPVDEEVREAHLSLPRARWARARSRRPWASPSCRAGPGPGR